MPLPARQLAHSESGRMQHVVQDNGFGMHELLAAGAIYLAANVLRVLRIAILCMQDRSTMRRLVSVHMLLLWPNSILPFKALELVRLAGFVALAKSHVEGGAIWLIERASDAIALLLLTAWLSFLVVPPEQLRLLQLLLIVFLFFAVSSAFAIKTILPYFYDDLLLRSRSKHGLAGFWIVCRLQEYSRIVEALLKGRALAVLLLAIFIWGLELIAISIVFGSSNIESVVSRLIESLSQPDARIREFQEPVQVFLFVLVIAGISLFSIRRLRSNAD